MHDADLACVLLGEPTDVHALLDNAPGADVETRAAVSARLSGGPTGRRCRKLGARVYRRMADAVTGRGELGLADARLARGVTRLLDGLRADGGSPEDPWR